MSVKNNTSYSLNNLDLLNKTLDVSIQQILDKYSNLIIEYIKFISENNKCRNKLYKNYITTRGLDTITNVFNHILYYSKNLDMAYFYSQKAFYFYVEFVQQISNDNNTFLQLTSRDATIYVYKKTIFEINHEKRKNIESLTGEEKQKLILLEEHVKIFKIVFSIMINDDEFVNNLVKEKDEFILEFNKINKKINKLSLNENEVILLQLFLCKLMDNSESTSIQYFFESIQNILTKIKKKTFTKEKLHK